MTYSASDPQNLGNAVFGVLKPGETLFSSFEFAVDWLAKNLRILIVRIVFHH